ncbi:calcium-binding protein [Aestuariivirga sp.]|uniref:calcium-binding protein n=1 Tax=Aestuariivirga sp. TaxID=2650926 RepID=UPI003594775D
MLNGLGGNDIINGGNGNDILNGGMGLDELFGGGGRDIYLVDHVSDFVHELDSTGGGLDVKQLDKVFSYVSYSLSLDDNQVSGHVEDLFLFGSDNLIARGNDGDNEIGGNDGNNIIEGGWGADIMDGGDGIDTAYYGSELFGVRVSIDPLTTALETGFNSAAGDELYGFENIVGSRGHDDLIGNFVVNRLEGGRGNDTLYGRGGRDVLIGGIGNDAFVFDVVPTASSADTLADFKPGTDRIVLSFIQAASLNEFQFVQGTAAAEADDRLIYDAPSGRLLYDPDGTGSNAAVLLAKLKAGVALSFQDFEIA